MNTGYSAMSFDIEHANVGAGSVRSDGGHADEPLEPFHAATVVRGERARELEEDVREILELDLSDLSDQRKKLTYEVKLLEVLLKHEEFVREIKTIRTSRGITPLRHALETNNVPLVRAIGQIQKQADDEHDDIYDAFSTCLLYTSPSPRD